MIHATKKYLSYVNVNMGTKSIPRRSNGNTLPLTQMPFGMTSFSIQTESGTPWYYHPEHEYAEGIRLTHQPSPWISDFGAVLMTPQNDVVAHCSDRAWSGRRLQDTVQRPDYLAMTFLRSNCRFELTPTERCAALRVTFGDDRPAYLSFLPVMPKTVIGLTIVAVGTSLPELVTAITSLIKGHGALSLGNIIGANIFNLVLVSGLSITIAPFSVPTSSTLFGFNSSLIFELPVMLGVMAILIIPTLIRGKLSRVQGIGLLAIYAAFLVVQLAFCVPVSA